MNEGISYNESRKCRQLADFGKKEDERMEETKKLMVSDIRAEIMLFAEEMERVMRKHDAEKGDSWKNIPTEYLLLKLQEEYGEASVDTQKNPMELVDLANVAMMLFYRYKFKVKLDQRID